MKFSSLPALNVLGRKGRSAALFAFALILAFAIFGGAVILASLRNGLRSLELRLGADIIAVPYEARTKVSADTILNQGNRTYFYMSRSYLQKIAAVEGVEAASPQLFLCSMNAGCCSVSLQLIGFDPETDFTIQPWVRERFSGTLGTGDILIGGNVTMPASGVLRFYGVDCAVRAQLVGTGTGLDNAVYMNFDTAKLLMDAAEEKGFTFSDQPLSSKVISSVMLRVKDGYSIDDVAGVINRRVRKVSAVKTKSMTSGIAASLAGVSRLVGVLILVVWALCVAVLAVVSSLITGERTKEFAVLRVMGASRRKLARLVMAESVLVNAAGALCGVMLAALCVLPFHGLVRGATGLPFLLPAVPALAAAALASLALSVLSGCLAAARAAHRIARIDTGVILRAGN